MTTFYHYCSTEAFVSIIGTRSIRMSALSLSNDSMEGRMVKSILMDFAKRDSLGVDECRCLAEYLGRLERAAEGLGFCLSEKKDLLSQWRGYAGDGCGLSIGFSAEYLEEVSRKHLEKTGSIISLEKVAYDHEEHVKQIEPIYSEIKDSIARSPFLSGAFEEGGQFKRGSELISRVVKLYYKMYLLKSSAFQEEEEWRLLRNYISELEGGVEYRACSDRIVAYEGVELVTPDAAPGVVEVLLGPKHITPIEAVAGMLKRYGFNDVDIQRSKASYR